MTLELATDRLILRKPGLEDAQALVDVINDERVAATTLNIPHPYSLDDAESWISSHLKEDPDKEKRNFSMFLKYTGILIGGVGIIRINFRHNTAEIGYWCGFDYWGQGYTTEAARALVDFAFRELELERVWATCFTTNPASARVMEKVGMKFEGTARHEFKKGDVYTDHHHYAILRSDWSAGSSDKSIRRGK